MACVPFFFLQMCLVNVDSGLRDEHFVIAIVESGERRRENDERV